MKHRWTLPVLFLLLFGAACCSRSATETTSAGSGDPATVNYGIEVRAPEKSAVGREAVAEVIVTPRHGYKINLEYPAKLVLSGVPAGTKIAAEQITKAQMSVEHERLTVPVRFTPEGPGEIRFSGELRFSVCNAQSCQMPRETVGFVTLAEGEAVAAAGQPEAAGVEAASASGAAAP